MPSAKVPGAVQQVVFPQAVEPLAVFRFQLIPARVEVFKPGHERPVVIGADQVPVFHDKTLFNSGADLRNGRHIASRKKIFCHEGIRRCRYRELFADGMQKNKAVIGQAAPGNLHEIPVIFIAHMFEDAHGDNAIGCPAQITIVLELDFDRELRAYLPAQVCLLPGNGDSGRRDAIFSGPSGARTTASRRRSGIGWKMSSSP